MDRDDSFDPFLDDVKGVKPKSKKDKKQSKKNDVLYGAASFDFGDEVDDDDTYGAAGFSSAEEPKQEKVTIQTLFEFKPWEVGVLFIEILLVTYLVLVVTKVLPLL